MTTTRDVLGVLRARIEQGWYEPDQHLVAAEVAADLSTSRTPVREALLLLESEGLVRGAPNRGFRVRPLSPRHISELYELRATLEGFAARKAAEQVGRGEPAARAALDRLPGLLDELDALVESTDLHAEPTVERMMATNVAIHDAVVDASGFATLPGLIRQTVDRGVIYRAFHLFGREQLRRSNEFHRMIVARIEANDAERAASLMAEHVFQSRDVVLAAIDEAGGDVARVFGAGRTGPAGRLTRGA